MRTEFQQAGSKPTTTGPASISATKPCFCPGVNFGRRPTPVAVDQAAYATQQKSLPPVIETRRAEAPALAQHRHGHLVHQQIDQPGNTPYQPHIIALIGVPQTAVQIFDGGTTELYPDAH